MTVSFFELPAGNYWEGVARLVSYLFGTDKIAVYLEEKEHIRTLSRYLWDLPPSLLVPHGIAGERVDESIDPVVLYPSSERSTRPIAVLVALLRSENVTHASKIIEPIASDDVDRDRRRARFRAYRDAGIKPAFVPWKEWVTRLR